MNITLTKQQQDFIREHVSSGIFQSETDAIDAKLKLLQQNELHLHQNISDSLSEVQAGKSRPFNQQVVMN
jgi:putative addiction module CopG family antidote